MKKYIEKLCIDVAHAKEFRDQAKDRLVAYAEKLRDDPINYYSVPSLAEDYAKEMVDKCREYEMVRFYCHQFISVAGDEKDRKMWEKVTGEEF